MANLTIGISDLKVCRPPDVLVTYALGSCVGICLLDSVAGVGGLSHIMLPDSTQATNGAATPMRFASWHSPPPTPRPSFPALITSPSRYPRFAEGSPTSFQNEKVSPG